ncbi:UBA/TS-N domain protein [Desulfitobacterium sp. PCE1]|uniref:UBA/TS-N domain protein n=1 Tax=Desulfitobacterium sp. PCE1 TaxID=146907 RepID=UPI00038076BB|nr:UBA/TS-N domain protein [Desulfitobacterium sp. PCE1]
MTPLEKVEKLCSMGNITFEEAKAALDAANGDLLDAIIYLEKQGKIHAPSSGGYYSSEKTVDAHVVSYQAKDWKNQHHSGDKENPFLSFFKDAWDFFLKLLRKGNENSFEVLKGTEVKGSFPITALVLLMIFAFWVTIPLMVIGLFFGFRYRFVGADIKATTINDAMDSAADAAENLKKSMDK